MGKEPKISAESIRKQLNGTYSGSDDKFYFWNTSIQSGSLWDIISGSDVYLRFQLGDAKWDSTDGNTSRAVKYCEVNYACFKTLVQLSGGVIIDGTNWSTGPIRVDNQSMLPAYRGLIEQFRQSALDYIRSLSPMHLHYEWDGFRVDRTAASAM